MARIRKINVSEVEGNNPFNNDNSILNDGTLALYNSDNGWKLRVHDGVTNGGKSLIDSGEVISDLTIQGSLEIVGTGSLNNENIVTSNTIQRIETITSSSYASLNPPLSGTLYLIID